ncbi:MAG TPA: LacI family DNA-binding transcriptional regulator [Terriglobales bacterium]|nr:LacI family DNA-binding transcriptional regulator [Terriglobales bacterium]
MKRTPTMGDVARLARVGKMTVSRVLNDHPHVTEKTRQRVFSAIAKLGYRPNEAARALRSERSKCIGLIVPSLLDSFFGICAHAIHELARERGYTVMTVASSDDPEVEAAEAEIMLRRKVDGIVVVPANHRRSSLTGKQFGHIPIVCFDRPVLRSSVDCVIVENEVGGNLAAQHLISHGHTRIAFVGPSADLFSIQQRQQGFRKTTKRAGLIAQEVSGMDSRQRAVELLGPLLSSKKAPTAIFTPNNVLTKFVLEALQTLQISVPEQVALVGFDDFELADVLKPTLTVVRQPAEDLGRTAANLLFQRLDSKDKSAPRHVTLPVELVVRNSCGCGAGRHFTASVRA